jgi:CopG family nickel-responsive transcriptional regulator
MQKVTRFGVSIEPELLEKFDVLARARGYKNRSKAMRDLIRRTDFCMPSITITKS